MQQFGFPGVIWIIDCTHVAILPPVEDEHIYFSRKRFHSKNVQLICDSNLRIINVNANFGGSTHLYGEILQCLDIYKTVMHKVN